MDTQQTERRPWRPAAVRIAVAVALAMAVSFGAYALLQAAQPNTGALSFSFLLILPAAVCAFVAYVADPWKTRSLGAYLLVPLWMLALVIAGSLVALREGAVCIVLLAPLWLVSGLGGAGLTYALRRRVKPGRVHGSALLLLPFAAMQVEAVAQPPPEVRAEVTRSVVVEAAAAEVWPLVQGIPDVRAGEGRWNFTQDVLGVPRPLGAHLEGRGVGAQRLARWGQEIRFREQITDWRPERRIGWRFDFSGSDGWDRTDPHLRPDSSYFRITTGGYELTPVGAGRTRVTLTTRYVVRTPVNRYSTVWGEVFLGDIESNLLALIKARAEAAEPTLRHAA